MIDKSNLKKAITNDVLKKDLVDYFIKKVGKDGLSASHSPVLWQDILDCLPHLFGYIELIPHNEYLDVSKDEINVGWNLFVLGIHRMYIGSTKHKGLRQTAHEYKANRISNTNYFDSNVTPRQMIAFICRVVKNSDTTMIDKQSLETNTGLNTLVTYSNDIRNGLMY